MIYHNIFLLLDQLR